MAFVLGDRSSFSLLAEIATLKSIIHNLSDGIIVADKNGKFLYFNKIAQSILGFGAVDAALDAWSEIYGCYRSDRITPFPSQELPLARALRGETVDGTEIYIRNQNRPDGAFILVKATPLRDEVGELFGGTAVLCDITKKKELDARINTLMNAVEQTADSIVITDTRGLIEYVNPAFEQTTGYAREEILGQTPAMLKSGAHDDSFYRKLWSAITSGNTYRATITNRKKNGDLYHAEQTITPMRDSGGLISHFVSVIKDVTEQRKLQEQETQMQLARAVQQQFYGLPPPPIEGFDIAGGAFPADATGGDYFDFVPLQGGSLGISIGDISGHGIGAALLMVELRSLLRAFSCKSDNVSDILASVNGSLVSDLERDRYAGLVFCRLHPPTRSLIYANAGHVPGYVLDANGAVKRILESTDIPLGMFSDRPFSCGEEFNLEPGDILALFTDGVVEAENSDQIPFGTERALEFLRTHRDKDARQLVRGLFNAVREFSGDLPQADDISIVICKSTFHH